ncbi:MAG: patatin-like phospholipase family protein [Clostridia bacterium]|nr:patatin-like phospholipase family protein [Clostridia bacterium]
MNCKSFALVLGGGAGLGFAHLGVIKYLEELGLKPNVVCGTSIGALIGGVYASGKSIDEIFDLIKDFNNFKILDFKIFPIMSESLLRSDKINNYLKELFGEIKIEDLPIKFGCVAVDLNKGELCEFTSGLLWQAVRASISVPSIFQPFEIDDKKFIDGGVMDNVPTELAFKMGESSNIAVNLIDYDLIMLEQKSLLHCLINTINLSQKELVQTKIKTDLLIQLHLKDVSMINFNLENAQKAFEQGYEQAKSYKEQLICKFINCDCE